jgi:hypothetical protein
LMKKPVIALFLFLKHLPNRINKLFWLQSIPQVYELDPEKKILLKNFKLQSIL